MKNYFPIGKDTLALAAAAMASVFFGLSFIFVKQSVDAVSTFTLLSWRFLFAFVGMYIAAILGLIKVDLKGKPLKPLLLVPLFQPIIYYILETWGIAMTTATESGIIIACIPIVTIILSAVMLKEPPTRRQTVSVLISVLGIIIMVLAKGISASLNIFGYVLLVLTTVSAGLYVIYARKAVGYTSAEKTFIMSATGAIVFTLCAVTEHAAAGTMKQFLLLPFTNMVFLVSLLYLAGACSVAATLLRNYAITVIGATRTASLAVLTTTISVFAGVLLLKEPFSFLQGVATVLVLIGVYGANKMPKHTGAEITERNRA
ncbi:MAG: DMT family transporter [Clostridiales bacterium]|nr:DMT family transporter [Clostridiales bacterium]